MQRVMVLASGKYKFVKNITKSKSKPRKAKTKTTKRRKSNPNKGGNRKMGKNTTQTLFKLVRLGALVAPAVGHFATPQPMKDKIRYTVMSYTGYDTQDKVMRWEWLASGWAPYLGAVLATYGIPKIAGILRML